jgi:hypothetical protein
LLARESHTQNESQANMTKRRVVILGGYGTFGRYIAEDLSTQPEAEVAVAGRNPDKGIPFANSLNIDFRRCDANSSSSLRDALEDAWLVINAAGPFQASNYTIPQICIDTGCHYIDMADGRDYVAEITQLDRAARARNVFVCAGASTTPAITSALVAALQPDLQAIRSIKVALNAGNKNPAGVSTIAAILDYLGLPIQVWQDGRWRTMRGWSAGEFVEFPSPVGRRRVQLCDVPDLALFPELFKADHVIFKAGVELTIFNYAIGVLANLRRFRPSLDLSALAGPLVAVSKLFKAFGTFHGGCAVWVTDAEGRQKSLALVAHENGPRIPGAPATLLARKLLTDRITRTGAFPCVGFLGLKDFADFLAPHNIFIESSETNGTGQSDTNARVS